MSWTWTLEKDDGESVGRSESFDSRSDAESWVGESFGELVEQGVDQVRLLDGDTEVYGPMSLHPET
ncbi:MAG: hypothetical protein ACR2FE_04180 [Aeromicrobium sp.]